MGLFYKMPFKSVILSNMSNLIDYSSSLSLPKLPICFSSLRFILLYVEYIETQKKGQEKDKLTIDLSHTTRRVRDEWT